ncbi:MAG: 50S ribosomal protein L24 [Acidimicrobiales bacterium]
MKLRKGDKVRVLTGKDRGKEGEIITAIPAENKVVVQGVNIAKRHQRALKATMSAGIIDREMPISASNVALICPETHKPTRVGYRFEDGGKVRISRRSGAAI